jgi:hypothetical protein
MFRVKERPMTRRLLGLILLLGCATRRGESPAPADSLDAAATPGVCLRQAAVTVHVVNQGSADVQIAFGPYAPARAAHGFSSTTYKVARSYLNYAIELRILRGGVQLGGPARISTEPVVCNDATLIIGPEPRISFFHGDRIPAPAGTPARSDSTSDSTSAPGGPSRTVR